MKRNLLTLFHLGLCLSKRPSRNFEEEQVTKEEGGQGNTLGIQTLVLLTHPQVRFNLAHE